MADNAPNKTEKRLDHADSHRHVPSSALDIDPAVGSFIYIPTEPSTRPLHESVKPSHQLLNVAASNEPVLVLNDYLVKPIYPIVEPALPSYPEQQDNPRKEQEKQQVTNSVKVDDLIASLPTLPTTPAIRLGDQPDETQLQQFLTAPLASTKTDSSVSVLKDINAELVEILGTQGDIKTLKDFSLLPTKRPSLRAFLIDSGLFPNVDVYIQRAISVIKHVEAPPVPARTIPPTEPAKPPHSSQQNYASTVRYSPLTLIEGIADCNADKYLHAHAYLKTIDDLATFRETCPGIYHILKDSGAIPKLDSFIETAKVLISTSTKFDRTMSGHASLDTLPPPLQPLLDSGGSVSSRSAPEIEQNTHSWN